MELRELRSFCVVAELKSISKAAEKLGIGQPAVTMHIKKLEQGMGVILLNRETRPISPTPAGTALAKLATPLVEGIESLPERSTAAEQEAPIHVAAGYCLTPTLLTRVLNSFTSVYPNIQVCIHTCYSDEGVEMGRKGQAYLVVCNCPWGYDDIDFEGLCLLERVLIAPKDHPIAQTNLSSLSQVAGWPLIVLKRGFTRAVLEASLRHNGLTLKPAVEVDNIELVKECVLSGLGVGMVPLLSIKAGDQDKYTMINMEGLIPKEQVGIVTFKDGKLSTSAKNFIIVARQTLGSGVSENSKVDVDRVFAVPRV